MSTRNSFIAIAVLILIGTIASLIFYNQMPELAASHWNAAGEVDGYMSRFWAAFLMPLFTLGMALLFFVIPKIDPLKANIARFVETFNMFIVLIVAFMLYIHALTLAWNLGSRFNMSIAMIPAMGLLFIFIGVLLRKAKRNFFIGIRTPWTLSSDTVWDETHRVGAFLFQASGVLMMIGVFFGEAGFWFMMLPLFASVIGVVVYSYVLYQRETKA
jgi:uncharacterized membrane protein